MYVSTCKTKQHDGGWLFGCLGIKWFTIQIVLKKCSVAGSWIQIPSIHPLKTMRLYICNEIWIKTPRKNQCFASLPCHRVCLSMLRAYRFSWYKSDLVMQLFLSASDEPTEDKQAFPILLLSSPKQSVSPQKMCTCTVPTMTQSTFCLVVYCCFIAQVFQKYFSYLFLKW